MNEQTNWLKKPSTLTNTLSSNSENGKANYTFRPVRKLVRSKNLLDLNGKTRVNPKFAALDCRALLDPMPSGKLVKMPGPRKQQALLYRLRLGGERNLFRQKNPNYTCNCNQNMPVTTSHILLECELNHDIRCTVINTLQEMQEEFTLKTLLNPPKPLWNTILQHTAQLVQTHPQGKDL